MSNFTYKEIKQQFDIWSKIISNIEKESNNWKAFFQKFQNYKIIFTGAGTSEFIGNVLEGYYRNLGLPAHSIASTDIVSSPQKYLLNEPTILISFARSGDSPESIAAVQLANKLISKIEHVVITCNNQGQLYKYCENKKNAHVILLPEEVNDKGFAMTSSFSSMMISAMSLCQIANESFDPKSLLNDASQAKTFEKVFEEAASKFFEPQLERVVYLGTGIFKGFAQEASLKLLELTQGKFPSFFDGTLAFRHGPKSILNKNTSVILFISGDKYERLYDIDLLKELKAQGVVKKIIILDVGYNKELAKYENYLSLNTLINNEIMAGLTFMYYLQLVAVQMSTNVGLNPDNPCPTGEVNRIVKGVNIYPYE